MTVAEARVDTMADRIEAFGIWRVNESVTITAAISDTITRTNFDEVQRVETGVILVEMTSVKNMPFSRGRSLPSKKQGSSLTG